MEQEAEGRDYWERMYNISPQSESGHSPKRQSLMAIGSADGAKCKSCFFLRLFNGRRSGSCLLASGPGEEAMRCIEANEIAHAQVIDTVSLFISRWEDLLTLWHHVHSYQSGATPLPNHTPDRFSATLRVLHSSYSTPMIKWIKKKHKASIFKWSSKHHLELSLSFSQSVWYDIYDLYNETLKQ